MNISEIKNNNIDEITIKLKADGKEYGGKYEISDREGLEIFLKNALKTYNDIG